ncbi:MAG: malto-oligosyltrehalose synthase, partial [Moorella sp. (in: Bacteria)]|nr:malto-oligosyltrehalose synthase [Moorella sp. (in: firmicutes)]
RRVACFGAVNSLAQVLLKITAPGVPDFYQGSELWDFSLVDPDNRRPVDFRHRAALLESLQEQEKNGLAPLARELCAHWEDGRIKLYLTYRALNLRRGCQELFASGEYIPLHASGGLNSHVCAFARRLEKAWAVAAVPRLLARLLGEVQRKPAEESSHWPFPDGLLPGRQIWGKSEIILPAGAPGEWSNVFTGEALLACAHSGLNTTGAASPREKALPLADLFANFPVALLVSSLSRTS